MEFLLYKIGICTNYKKSIFISIVVLSSIAQNLIALTKTPAIAPAKWTVLIYVQASNSLSNFAGKNFSDMATVGSNKDLNVLVQWYKPSQEGIWRYKVEKNYLSLDSHINTGTDGSSSKDLIDAMAWAATKYPAENYGLILWNHGIGVLDPQWGKSIMLINNKRTQNNPRATIEGITVKNDIPEIDIDFYETMPHRGILFNEKTKTYMDNKSLLYALDTIKTTVLNGKKLNFIGMDACLMAMAEVGYQIRDHAHYLVASQEVELAYGWNYSKFLTTLATGQATTLQAVQSIVSGYENLYKNKIHFYTQSAIDLDLMNDIKTGIDLTVDYLNDCKKMNNKDISEIIRRSRNNALQFSASVYIDLYSFYYELLRNLNLNYNKNRIGTGTKKFFQKVQELKEAISICMQLIDKSIIANTAGKYLAKAKGMSIYFPNNEAIDSSYKNTLFGKDSLWLPFLADYSQ